MLETGFYDQIKSFYKGMIRWRAIRSWASLCGDRALHAEMLDLQSAATVGLADRAPLRNTPTTTECVSNLC